jgi:hypothetical protein
MTSFIGSTIMAAAVLLGIAYGLYVLWRKGKLAHFSFVPKPPATTTTTEQK